MKSLSTMMWLTITPARLTIASSAMNPSGESVSQSPSNAPMSPSGTVSITTTDFTTELNWSDHRERDERERDFHHQSHFRFVLAQLLVLAGELHFVARVQFDFREARSRAVQNLRKAIPQTARRL